MENQVKYKPNCHICEAKYNLIDTEAPGFSNFRKKLQDITNFEQNNWLRFMCICCKEKLDDIWEFQILCKNAYKKFLDVVQKTSLVENQSIEVVFIPGETIKGNTPENNEWDLLEQSLEKHKSSLKKRKTKTPIKEQKPKLRKPVATPKSTQPESFTCSLCNGTFKAKLHLKQHINRVHLRIRNFLCTICGQKCISNLTLREHEQTHSANRTRIPCEICDKTFTSEKNVRRHVSEVHGGPSKRKRPQSYCKYCSITFASRIEYFKHMESHPEARIRRMDGIKKPSKFTCRYCLKEFIGSQQRESHERVHTGEKPFKCEICSKDFRQEVHLYRHRNVHTGERRYPCEYCDKVFTEAGSRRVHTRLHTGEKPYECPNCPERFHEQKMWKKHSIKCTEKCSINK